MVRSEFIGVEETVGTKVFVADGVCVDVPACSVKVASGVSVAVTGEIVGAKVPGVGGNGV
jgi:hypothetical protein